MPQAQVAAGQMFPIEWSTGHPGSYYYFVVLKASDEHQIAEHTFDLMDDYIQKAPQDAYIYEAPEYRRMHVSCTYLYPQHNGKKFLDCPEHLHNDGSKYQGGIVANDDPLKIDREAYFGAERATTTHFHYTDSDLASDQRVAYNSSDYPWIEAVHKVKINYRNPREWDIAHFSIPARGGGGEYLIHVLWRGYRDVIDVDVLPQDAVKPYGRPGQVSRWVKTEHCMYPNYQKNSFTHCHYLRSGESVAACQNYCEGRSGSRCTALNVVPLHTPAITAIAGVIPNPEIPWNKKCKLEDIPGWAKTDDSAMVCYTFEAKEPTDDGFNPETEDIWYVRDYDDQDPIFYSTCYRRDVVRDFSDNVPCPLCEVTASNTPPQWHFGESCMSCQDAAKQLGEDIVSLPSLSKVCEKCSF